MTTEQKSARAIVTLAFNMQPSQESRIVPVLLSERHQEVLKFQGGLLTVSMLNGLVVAPDSFTMASLQRQSEGSVCFQCGAPLTVMQDAFRWEDRTYPAMACAACNVLWLKENDNHLDCKKEQTEKE